MRVVDVHTHVIPKELVDLLRSGDGPAGLEVVDRPGRDPLIVHDGGLRYPVHGVFADVGAKLAQMDRDGIDISVVSVAPTLLLYWARPDVTVGIARLLNDALSTMAAESDGRLALMATVPMNDPAAAADELRRARVELGAVAVQIGTCVGDVQLDDASLDPFFDTAAELGMPVMLHPYVSMLSAPGPDLRGFHLANVVGNPHDTYVAASRLIVGGRFDRTPALRVQLVHGGGSFPYQLGRLQHAYDAREDTSEVARRRPLDYVENFLFDTVLFEPQALDFLLALVGPERVLFGTDIPFDMADVRLLREGERLDPTVAAGVLGDNAMRIYRLGETLRERSGR